MSESAIVDHTPPTADMRPEGARAAAVDEKFGAAVAPLAPSVVVKMPALRVVPAPPLLVDTKHYGSAELVRGFAIKVPGSARLDSAATRDAIVHHELGAGTSLYPIEGSTHDLAAIERSFRAAAESGKLPRLHPTASAASIAVHRQTTALGDNYVLAVKDMTDGPAALNLMERVADAAHAGTPMTVAELAHSSDYKDLLVSAQCVRDQTAKATADALGLALTQRTPTHTAIIHSIVPSSTAAHGSDADSGQYVVYNDAANASESHQGAFISHGTLGDLTHVATTRTRVRAGGSETSSWLTDFLSAVPASTGAFDPTVHSKADLHHGSSAAAAQAFDRKVHWKGDIRRAHPRQSDAHAAQNDKAVVTWMDQFVSPKEKVPLATADMHFVAGVLPDTSTIGMTTEALATVASTGELASMPVLMRSDTVQTLARNWDEIASAAGASYSPGVVFKQTRKEAPAEIFTSRSGCAGGADGAADPSHFHPWHGPTDSQAPLPPAAAESTTAASAAAPRAYRYSGERTHARMTQKTADPRTETVLALDSALVLQVAAVARRK